MNKNVEIKELVKNTLIMLAITLIAGFILGFVYEITKDPIANMEEKARQEANAAVFVNASSFEEQNFDKDQMLKCLEDDFENVEITEVLVAKDSGGGQIGYVFEITSHEGFGGDIVFRMGVQNDGTVNAIAITSISETAGLGMRAEEVIVPQFFERRADSFEVTKTGAALDNQIDAISSATITSKAFVNGVNAGLLYLREVLGGGVVNE